MSHFYMEKLQLQMFSYVCGNQCCRTQGLCSRLLPCNHPEHASHLTLTTTTNWKARPASEATRTHLTCDPFKYTLYKALPTTSQHLLSSEALGFKTGWRSYKTLLSALTYKLQENGLYFLSTYGCNLSNAFCLTNSLSAFNSPCPTYSLTLSFLPSQLEQSYLLFYVQPK